MKKKLVLIVVAVVLLLTFVLAGCNLLVTNEERDGDQVVATVKHNGLVGEITKKEFMNYFQQNYQQYSQYFDWTFEEYGETFLSMMTRNKMTVILAVEYLAKQRGETVDKDKFNAINNANIKYPKHNEDVISSKGYDVYAAYLLSLLDWDEQKYVKEQTNKMFQDEYDEDVETAIENLKIKEEEENKNSNKDKNTKEPRPTQDKNESTEFKPDASVGKEDVLKIEDFFTATAKKLGDKAESYEKDAYKTQVRDLKRVYLTYDYYLAKQAESRILTKYQESDEFTDKTTDMNVKVSKYFEKLMYDQELSNKTASNYKSALEGDSVVVFHNGRYVKLKSILLKFSDEQTKALEYINNYYKGENAKDIVNQLREALVFGNVSGIQIPELVESALELRVYKSNPDYDPTKPAGDPSDGVPETDEEIAEKNYPYIPNKKFDPSKDESKENQKWVSVPFNEVIAELGAALKKAEEKAGEEYDNNEQYKNDGSKAYEIGRKMYINQKKAELFEDWIYIVNDDDGMFQGKEYIETPYGNSSDYVSEFTALVRTLLGDYNTAGTVMIDTSKHTGTVVGDNYSNIVKSEVDVEYFENNIAKKKKVAIYTDTTNNISFVINEFGVHIVMLTDVPVDEQYNTIGIDSGSQIIMSDNDDFDLKLFENSIDTFSVDEINAIKKANAYYAYTLNAYVDFDEETGKAITLEELLNKQLKKTYDSTAYSKHNTKLFEMYGDELFNTKDDKEASEGYADYKFEEIKMYKSVFNKALNELK